LMGNVRRWVKERWCLAVLISRMSRLRHEATFAFSRVGIEFYQNLKAVFFHFIAVLLKLTFFLLKSSYWQLVQSNFYAKSFALL
jgi:hypothetical protein